MPTPPLSTRRPAPLPVPQAAAQAPAAGYVVRPGDTLSAIARRVLGDGARWRELQALNRDVIGADPRGLRPGMRLRLPGQAPAPNKPTNGPTNGPTNVPTNGPTNGPANGPAKPQPADPRRDSDGDGLIDRYDAAPRDARDRRWNAEATQAYAAFVGQRTQSARQEGLEIDCADFAIKLMSDFCRATGIPNPLAKEGRWRRFTPERTGGLPNVQGPNEVFEGVYADKLAKRFTRDVNDANGNGVAGFDRATGKVDVADLRAGDILFYDWDADGKVDHTVNVVGVDPDGSVTLAYGTYNNLGEQHPVRWQDLDLQPVERLELKPGSEEYQKWLGDGNCLWGARRFSWLADKQREAAPAVPQTQQPQPQAQPQAQAQARTQAGSN